VSSVEVVGRVARCQVRGSIEPLLKVLAKAGVKELLSREPSLEELFLALYGAGTQAVDVANEPGAAPDKAISAESNASVRAS
jgi:ABC-2 type transport system ATP-binding protein